MLNTTDWSAAQTLEEVVSPEVANYTYDKETVPSLEVTNESTDSTVYVIYKPVAPTTTPATSTDIQGKPQTGTPTYKHADGTELKPTTDNPAKFRLELRKQLSQLLRMVRQLVHIQSIQLVQ